MQGHFHPFNPSRRPALAGLPNPLLVVKTERVDSCPSVLLFNPDVIVISDGEGVDDSIVEGSQETSKGKEVPVLPGLVVKVRRLSCHSPQFV